MLTQISDTTWRNCVNPTVNGYRSRLEDTSDIAYDVLLLIDGGYLMNPAILGHTFHVVWLILKENQNYATNR